MAAVLVVSRRHDIRLYLPALADQRCKPLLVDRKKRGNPEHRRDKVKPQLVGLVQCERVRRLSTRSRLRSQYGDSSGWPVEASRWK